jgi:hypothetical protein
MGTHVLPPLAVNSKSERKVDSMPSIAGTQTFGTLAHLSDRSAKSHPWIRVGLLEVSYEVERVQHQQNTNTNLQWIDIALLSTAVMLTKQFCHCDGTATPLPRVPFKQGV